MSVSTLPLVIGEAGQIPCHDDLSSDGSLLEEPLAGMV